MAPRKVLPHEERSARTRNCFAQAAAIGADDPAARDKLLDEVVELNLQVAQAIARRYRNRGVPVEDLEQVASLALVRAARRFDLRQDRDFLSYAVPTMTGEVKRYFRDLGWTIRPPRRIQEVQSMALAVRDSRPELGRSQSVDEVAAEIGVAASEVAEALGAEQCYQPLSLDNFLDAEPGTGQPTAQPFITHDTAEVDAIEARLVLAPGLRSLASSDRALLRLRYVEGLTQGQIAKQMGISQMTVSRRLTAVIDRLRSVLDPTGRREAAA